MQGLPLLFAWSLLLLKLTIANPLPVAEPGTWNDWSDHTCISDAQATDFVTKIHSLYHCMDPSLAEQTLTPDFTVHSYSMVRTIYDLIPDGQEIYVSSRDELIQKGLASNPATCPLPPQKDYKIWNGCNFVAYWWSTIVWDVFGDPTHYKFIGIDILEIDVASMKVKAAYSEYSV